MLEKKYLAQPVNIAGFILYIFSYNINTIGNTLSFYLFVFNVKS